MARGSARRMQCTSSGAASRQFCAATIAPSLAAASSSSTQAAQLRASMPTRSPRRMPAVASTCARRFTRSFKAAKVTRRSPSISATSAASIRARAANRPPIVVPPACRHHGSGRKISELASATACASAFWRPIRIVRRLARGDNGAGPAPRQWLDLAQGAWMMPRANLRRPAARRTPPGAGRPAVRNILAGPAFGGMWGCQRAWACDRRSVGEAASDAGRC